MTAKSGTGKIFMAMHLARLAASQGSGEQDVLYICSSAGLKSFVNSQLSCSVTVVNRTNSLSPSQKDMVSKAKLILVDDVHAIELDEQWESNPNDLYRLLFTHLAFSAGPNRRVAIFLDPEQDYKENLPNAFDKRLRRLAETVPGLLRHYVTIFALNERI